MFIPERIYTDICPLTPEVHVGFLWVSSWAGEPESVTLLGRMYALYLVSLPKVPLLQICKDAELVKYSPISQSAMTICQVHDAGPQDIVSFSSCRRQLSKLPVLPQLLSRHWRGPAISNRHEIFMIRGELRSLMFPLRSPPSMCTTRYLLIGTHDWKSTTKPLNCNLIQGKYFWILLN